MSVSNIDKLLQYMKCVAKQPIEYGGKLDTDSGPRIVNDEGKLITIVGSDVPITEIKLNETFFYSDTCMNCGGCDPAESNIFTETEYKRIILCEDQDFLDAGLDPKYLHMLRDDLTETQHTINGKQISTWSYPQIKNELYLPVRAKQLNRCSWCFQEETHRFKCRIHPVVSITCTMPHFRFYHNNKSNKTSIGIHQFGRNWALKCPVTFNEPQTEEEFNINKANRLNKLQLLYEASLDLNIDTWLPEMIAYIDAVEFEEHKQYLNINILHPQAHSKQLF